ncbi:dTDP-4-dehydrorhamnose 3,5-epimerase [Escherichia coli]|uniref:dTDP-4-dehydrorhamnose 3,5-epimerase n=1 Tax=Escherichia coli TaxID=562 RepID=UPI0032B35F16
MKIANTKLDGLLVIEPTVYEDERGFFYESYNEKKFMETIGASIKFVQDNHSKSSKGVLRGLHFQKNPYEQGKLVRCIRGEVYDVAVDIRKDSPTFGLWFGVNLSDENKKQLWIPEGFAHGFITLSDVAEFVYKTTNYYAPASEYCLKWDDKDLNIQWPLKNALIVSSKDQKGKAFADFIIESNEEQRW